VRLCLFENGRIEMVVKEKLVLELCVILGVFPVITFEMDSIFLVLNGNVVLPVQGLVES
jgi:hypothetical protein